MGSEPMDALYADVIIYGAVGTTNSGPVSGRDL
jgi:hypothetical protein